MDSTLIFLATVLCAYLVVAAVLFQFFKVQTQVLLVAYNTRAIDL